MALRLRCKDCNKYVKNEHASLFPTHTIVKKDYNSKGTSSVNHVRSATVDTPEQTSIPNATETTVASTAAIPDETIKVLLQGQKDTQETLLDISKRLEKVEQAIIKEPSDIEQGTPQKGVEQSVQAIEPDVTPSEPQERYVRRFGRKVKRPVKS